MNSQKIAIVVCAWPPQGGGMGSNAYYHAQKLSALSYRITVFAPVSKKPVADDAFVLSSEKNWFGFGHAGFLFSLFKKLKSFNLIHLYYPFFGTDLIVWLFKKINPQIKLVIHYQMDPVGYGWQRVFFRFYFWLFLRLIVKASDKIVVLSRDHAESSYLKKYLRSYPEKFAVVPNGVDTDIFYPRARDLELAARLNITAEDRTVVFVGGLDRQHYFKGVEILLAAFNQLNVSAKKLLIVGDGDFKNHYQKIAGNLKIDHQVIFTGWVKNEDLSGYYALADVFVLPSTARTESFGIVTAEAQACGLPAIVSDWPGSRQTIADGQTGFLIKPGSVDDLKEKLEKLLGDENLRHKMGEKGAERVRVMYGWDKVVKGIDGLYQGLLDSKSKITNLK